MGKEKGAVAVKNVDSSFVREGVTVGPKLNLCSQLDAPSEGAALVIGKAQISERVIPLAAFAIPKAEFRALQGRTRSRRDSIAGQRSVLMKGHNGLKRRGNLLSTLTVDWRPCHSPYTVKVSRVLVV